MTEAEWLAATDPTPMLEFIRGKASDRRLRLFALVSCRHSLQCFGHYDLDGVVDWAEKCLEETVEGEPPEEITGAIQWATTEMCESLNCLGEAVSSLLPGIEFNSVQAQQTAKWIVEAHQIADVDSSAENEAREQSRVIRDIFGNPFRPVVVDSSWLTSTVLALASGIYQDRDFDRMPILADALQDAGCDNDDILNHCRDANQLHVRGCWVVDLMLSKT